MIRTQTDLIDLLNRASLLFDEVAPLVEIYGEEVFKVRDELRDASKQLEQLSQSPQESTVASSVQKILEAPGTDALRAEVLGGYVGLIEQGINPTALDSMIGKVLQPQRARRVAKRKKNE